MCREKSNLCGNDAGVTRATENKRDKRMSATLDYSGIILKSEIRL